MEHNKWKDFYKSIGNDIASKRSDAGLSLDKAAKSIGLQSSATLHRYETGERTPPLHVVLQLGKLLADDYHFFILQSSLPAGGTMPPDERSSASLSGGGGLYALIEQYVNQAHEEQTFLSRMIRQISQVLNIGVISLFEYRWAESTLQRIDQCVHPVFDYPLSQKFEEEYNVWQGRYVTELAWRNSEEAYRFITDYERLQAAFPTRVNRQSIEWHTKVFGTALSTMYGIIGTTQPRYAIRCFNRSDLPQGRLDRLQYDLLTKLCMFMSTRLDIKAQERALEGVRMLTTALKELQNQGGDMRTRLGVIYESLRNVGAGNVAILWDPPHSRQDKSEDDKPRFQEGLLYGPYFTDGLYDSRKVYLSASFHKRIKDNDNYFVEDMIAREELKNDGDSTLDFYLKSLDGGEIGRLLVFPFVLEDTENTSPAKEEEGAKGRAIPRKGAIILPVKTGNFVTIDIPRAIPDTMTILQTYAAITQEVIQNGCGSSATALT